MKSKQFLVLKICSRNSVSNEHPRKFHYYPRTSRRKLQTHVIQKLKSTLVSKKKMTKTHWNLAITDAQEDVNLVDLVKSFPRRSLLEMKGHSTPKKSSSSPQEKSLKSKPE